MYDAVSHCLFLALVLNNVIFTLRYIQDILLDFAQTGKTS